ncbi:pilin, partial [Xanthomonas campestris]|uniref:pilin n=1 Tax=Xanthomonas campestris TaxID=339 RepID=UPI002269E302
QPRALSVITGTDDGGRSAAADTGTAMPAAVTIESQASKYVASVAYAGGTTNGIITAISKDLGGTATGTITLTGTKSTNGQVAWVCGGTIPAKYRPATCQG